MNCWRFSNYFVMTFTTITVSNSKKNLYIVFVIVTTSLSLKVGINISGEGFTSVFKVKVRNSVICLGGKTRSDVIYEIELL